MVYLNTHTENGKARWCSLPEDGSFRSSPRLERNLWVKLPTPLTAYCHDQALLLFPQSETVWLAWIPDHGLAQLSIEQFCLEG